MTHPNKKHSVVIDGFTVAIVDAFTTDSGTRKRDLVHDKNICIKMGDVVYGSPKALVVNWGHKKHFTFLYYHHCSCGWNRYTY